MFPLDAPCCHQGRKILRLCLARTPAMEEALIDVLANASQSLARSSTSHPPLCPRFIPELLVLGLDEMVLCVLFLAGGDNGD